jgi:Site-specific recombinase XerD
MSKKYEFNERIEALLQSFLFHLKGRKMNVNTIRQNRNYAGLYLEWLDKEGITPAESNYNDLLSFIDHCHKQRMPSRVINRILLAIRHYYNHLDTGHNPAAGIVLKGAVRTIPHDLLSKEDLEGLYNQYQVIDERSQRNKTILGLLIYQALTTEELHKLEAHHIKLKEGKIIVPGGRHSNGRTLKLEATQILELHEYISMTRPKILKALNAGRPGRKPDQVKEESELHQLFISMNGSEDMKVSLLNLMRALRKIHVKVRNAKQFRQSVITEWLKEKDLRTVQYMAGHRYVSSTERYRSYNLQDLEAALTEHHPLK